MNRFVIFRSLKPSLSYSTYSNNTFFSNGSQGIKKIYQKDLPRSCAAFSVAERGSQTHGVCHTSHLQSTHPSKAQAVSPGCGVSCLLRSSCSVSGHCPPASSAAAEGTRVVPVLFFSPRSCTLILIRRVAALVNFPFTCLVFMSGFQMFQLQCWKSQRGGQCK